MGQGQGRARRRGLQRGWDGRVGGALSAAGAADGGGRHRLRFRSWLGYEPHADDCRGARSRPYHGLLPRREITPPPLHVTRGMISGCGACTIGSGMECRVP